MKLANKTSVSLSEPPFLSTYGNGGNLMSHRPTVACPTAPFQEIQSLDAPVSREPDAGPLVEDVELDVPGPQVRVLSAQISRSVGDFIASLNPRQRDLARGRGGARPL